MGKIKWKVNNRQLFVQAAIQMCREHEKNMRENGKTIYRSFKPKFHFQYLYKALFSSHLLCALCFSYCLCCCPFGFFFRKWLLMKRKICIFTMESSWKGVEKEKNKSYTRLNRNELSFGKTTHKKHIAYNADYYGQLRNNDNA